MGEMKISVAEIKELMDKMAKTELGQLVIEEGDYKLKLCSKQAEKVAVSVPAPSYQTTMEAPQTSAAPAAVPASVTEPEKPQGNVVESPIVGTYYNSPSPEKPAFVTVGQKVKKGDVLFIIESMKLMNEIQSEYDGEIVDILVDNETPVEFGQSILVIK